MALRPMTQQEASELELGKLLKKITSHPQTRREAYKLLKKAVPATRFPDQDLEDYKEQEAQRRRNEDLQRENARVLTEMKAARERVAQRYSDAHMKEIEALMEKHGITDYEVGAKLWAADNANSDNITTSNPQGQTWSMPDDKDLLADPRKWATDQAARVIDEFKRDRRISR